MQSTDCGSPGWRGRDRRPVVADLTQGEGFVKLSAKVPQHKRRTMRNPGEVRRLLSAEECVALMRFNLTASIVAGVCLATCGIVSALAWRVLSA